MNISTLAILRISIIILGCILSSSYAQNKTQLQNKKKKLQQEINYTNSLIKKNKKKQENSVKQIEKLNTSIEKRSELIDNFSREVEVISNEINLNQNQVKSLEKQLEALRKSYAKMVVQAWKSRHNTSNWLYLLSAKNFNQAIRRYQYFKQVNELRMVQSKSISYNKNELGHKIAGLKNSKAEKENLISEKNNEIKNLENEKKIKGDELKKLKKKEKDLLAQVKKHEKERDVLDTKINSYIEKSTSTKSNTSTKTKTNTSTKNSNTTKTEVKNTTGNANSNGFESNKGKLSWPVNKGIITGKYGVHQHPVLDKVEVKNDGIDISTDKGASVRAVYKGMVTGVFKVDGYENVVIIRHGDYLTVYSHLSQVIVSKGNDISTDQKIGTAATNSEGETYINFQVRFGSSTQNPTSWLTK